jgi:RHS repeat-associated protein
LLITMTDGVGSENYFYNALEQMTQLQKVINGTTYTTNYAYNVAGELTQITYPSGRVVQQSVDAIGRLCEIAPSTSGCGSASNPYATGYSYSVASKVTGFKYGNGIYASLGFSQDRLQLNCLDYSTTNRGQSCTHDSTTKFGLTYGYPSAPNNNGLIASITDSVDNGRTVAYTYDPLSRLSTAVTTGSTNYPQWGLSWGYDRYGNRLNQTLTAGSGYQGSVQVTASSNRINCIGGSGQSCTGGVVPTYDSNGNMTYDGTNTLVYDAENHATSATNQSSAGTYTYDGNGNRVQKVSSGTSTVYVYSGSKVIAEYDGEGGIRNEYVYGGGTLLAAIGGGGVSNGGFEQGSSGWSLCNGDAQVITNASKAHSGNNYLQISTTAGSCVQSNQHFAVSPGDQITFGGWGYLESGPGPYVRWIVGFLDSGGHYVGNAACTPQNFTTGVWTYQVGTATIPTGVATVFLYAEVYIPTGLTVARFDDGFLSAGTKYYHQDHLSNRLVTSSAGVTLEQIGHYPFGDPWYNATNDKLYFTTYERDSESGNDYAMARYFRWLLGRFLSLDSLSGSTHDPQSLNRYVYAANNPVINTDPSGRCIPPGSPVLGYVHQGFQCPPNTMGDDVGMYGDTSTQGSSGYCGAQYTSCGSDNPVFFYTPTGFGDPRCGINAACIARGYNPFGSPLAQVHCYDDDGSGCQVGSYQFSHQNDDGTWTVDWVAQRQGQINAAINDIYQAFRLIAQNMGLDPSAQIPVGIQYNKGVWGVWLSDCGTNCTVDPSQAQANGGWADPLTIFHQGNSSWYFGSLFGFDAGHLVGGNPASAHMDPYGPLNPFHALLQLPTMLYPPGPIGYTTCSVSAGCQ